VNVTTGNISALAGIGDDASKYQITAPVQPGNSGGPLLDQFGNVVGVVVATLDALGFANATGNIPQNVNFAIKGTVVQEFLRAHSVSYRTALSQDEMSSADASQRATKFTVVIECWKSGN
jgi:S1-C subfamily serine protease